MNQLFSPAPYRLPESIATIRVVVGLLLLYHGLEVFEAQTMLSYTGWDIFKGPAGLWLVYGGKASELVAGILLCLGLFTRLAAILVVGTFLFITFFVGEGRFWDQEQHPFMFALFGMFFLFAGPGRWSLDAVISRRMTGRPSSAR